jgi:hypothetical protein
VTGIARGSYCRVQGPMWAAVPLKKKKKKKKKKKEEEKEEEEEEEEKKKKNFLYLIKFKTDLYILRNT